MIDMKTLEFVNDCELACKLEFSRHEETALYNQSKVLKAFRDNRISARHFAASNGYGYGDIGKEALCAVYGDVFCSESAVVSPLIASGTHAISLCIHGLLRPGDRMLVVSGMPYDTICKSIFGENVGSLKDFGIAADVIDLRDDGTMDAAKISAALTRSKYALVYVQRSRGYAWRRSFTISQISEVCTLVKNLAPGTAIFCDNCYGEFVEKFEPVEAGADIIAGSLIKNAGGGLAQSGGYIAGRRDLVEKVANRLTAPGLGTEVGSNPNGYSQYFMGLFMAPHATLQAIKGSLLFGKILQRQGIKTLPGAGDAITDITRAIEFGDEKRMTDFVRIIQTLSPVDAYVVPYAWDMPGYADKVIMAAGTFVQGATSELSCDGPMRPPYIAYMQGGLTYEHVKLAVIDYVASSGIPQQQ